MNVTAQPVAAGRWQFGLPWLLLGMVWLSAAFAVGTQFGACEGLVAALLSAGVFRGWLARGISVIACVAFAIALWQVGIARESARESVRQGQMAFLALALLNYHENHGSFPPAYIADENGRPMHSWRVLLLPYIERQDLFKRYRFDEPWNGPNNRLLAKEIVRAYHGDDLNNPNTDATYLAVVGPNTAWGVNEGRKLSEFSDGAENTLLVVEVAHSGIHWLEPRDLDMATMAQGVNIQRKLGIRGRNGRWANAAYADGRYRPALPTTLSWNKLKALLTINGGEAMQRSELEK